MEEDEKIEKNEAMEEVQEESKTVEVVNNINTEERSNVNTNMEGESKTFSIAALVLGIAAFAITKSGVLSVICAVLAIIFGVKGQKQAGKGMAKAGFILGIVYLALIALAFILVTVVGVSFLATALK